MSKWTRRNLVPGHYKGIKSKAGRFGRSKSVLNPGYDMRDVHGPPDLWWRHNTKRQMMRSHAQWYKPFKSKPNKRRDKRGQSKPR